MNRKQIIAMWLLHRRRKRRRNNRSYWVHPINQMRCELGAFFTLFGQLREDGSKFFNYFRMSVSSFDELHDPLKGTLQRQNTKMRNCIEPVEMIAVTLRYLASGCTFTDLHYIYRIGISTIGIFVKEVCAAIWSVLHNECLPTPTIEQWELIASHFEKTANFPHCLGAVDGKHIRLVCPVNSGSMFFNYKEYYSIVLMAIAVYVDIGSFGKECDSTIFKQSNLWKYIENGKIPIPEDKSLPGSTNPKIPYYFIGDEAFGLQKHLLRPYGGTHLTVEKRVFDYTLCRARRYVECTFGILSNKFRIFHRPINLQPGSAVKIVKACVILHNFIRDRDGYDIDDTTTITGFEDLPGEHTTRGGLAANSVRNILSQYFLTDVGRVPWQMKKI